MFQGETQPEKGIYIKSVVGGGAADLVSCVLNIPSVAMKL